MTIKYTFTNQFNPIRGVIFLEKKTFTIKELRLYLTNKHNLNMSEYSVFQKKKKLNDDYIFCGDSDVVIYEKCKLSPNERRKLLLKTRKML